MSRNRLATWPLPLQSPLLPEVPERDAPGRLQLLQLAHDHAYFITQWHCHKRRHITRSKALAAAVDACVCAGLDLRDSGALDKREAIEDRAWSLHRLLSVILGSFTASYRWPPRCGYANVTRWVGRGVPLHVAVQREHNMTTTGDRLASRVPGWCRDMPRAERVERIRYDMRVDRGLHFGLDRMQFRATYHLEGDKPIAQEAA